ncbi:MAG: alpha/beta hydrolase [Candidatus Rokuibacteriota bacterium]|nr:MAG: alpha/beta hydrolase [Candidatus Rokubacteria bacterium]
MTTERASPEAPEAPAVSVSRIEALATRQLTPCGAGSMVWRIWGEGRPLVLLHGASGSWTHWIRNILPLARHVRVLAPDMPGFGDSDVPPQPHTADALADLLASGLHVVVPPPTELDIAGFSFGGIIGGLVAARLGRRVRTLVLLGAGGMALPRAPMPPLLPIQPDMAPAEIQRVHRENLRILMMANPDKVDDLASSCRWRTSARRASSPGLSRPPTPCCRRYQQSERASPVSGEVVTRLRLRVSETIGESSRRSRATSTSA